MNESNNLHLKDVQKVLEEFSKMDHRNKELALAMLQGMRLVAENKDSFKS